MVSAPVENWAASLEARGAKLIFELLELVLRLRVCLPLFTRHLG